MQIQHHKSGILIITQLLANPLFQSGILPFVCALLIIFALRPAGRYWPCLGLAAAFFIAVYFIVGFQLLPFTSTRKILVLLFAATVLGLALDAFPGTRKYRSWLLAACSTASALWILWSPLSRLAGTDLWLMACGSVVYVVWLVVATEKQRKPEPLVYAGVLAICTGTSLSALFGASALLGQLGGALAAATSAFILFAITGRAIPPGITFTFPATLSAALMGLSGTVYGTMPWYSLIPVAGIPLLLALPLPEHLSNRQKLLIMCFVCLLASAIAVGTSWYIAGAPPV